MPSKRKEIIDGFIDPLTVDEPPMLDAFAVFG